MNVIVTQIKASSDSREVQIELDISGNFDVTDLKTLQVHVYRIEKLREAWSASAGGVGSANAAGKIRVTFRDLEEGVYVVSGATTDATGRTDQRTFHTVGGERFFNVPLSLTSSEVSERVRQITDARHSLITRAHYAGEVSDGLPEFQAIVYYSGVPLDAGFAIEGAEVYPVQGAIEANCTEAPLSADIERLFGVKASFHKDSRAEYSASNHILAVRIFKIRANDAANALVYARQFADVVTLLIATERLEKPQHCANFIVGPDGYAFFPRIASYRGNLAAPMFKDVHASLHETYQPVIQKHDRARFLLTLLTEAIGERDLSFQCYRLWVILEQIAKVVVTSKSALLIDPQGQRILDNNSQPQTTKYARGKVYEYLRLISWPAFKLSKQAPDARDVWIEGWNQTSKNQDYEWISLWDAVSAMYEIRNKVVHEGTWRLSRSPSDEERLSQRILCDGPFQLGFLYAVTSKAVWNEVQALK